jgi:hypothetical protein
MALAITYAQIEAELIEQGVEQGADRKSREIARAMLREGMMPEVVARLTQLPIATVEGFVNEPLPH